MLHERYNCDSWCQPFVSDYRSNSADPPWSIPLVTTGSCGYFMTPIAGETEQSNPGTEGAKKKEVPPLPATHGRDVQTQKVRRPGLENGLERPTWRIATTFAFVVAIVCSSALGYALFRFFNVLSLPSRGTHELVFLARAGIMGVATTLAITFVMLGFATFMIGARGEFRVQGEYAKSKGLLQSGAPGLFFVLCGTVVLCVLLSQKFSFDETAMPPGPVGESKKAGTATSGISTLRAGRSIASGGEPIAYEEIGFFSQEVSAYNAFATLVTEGEANADNAEFFFGTWVKPIRITCVRFSWYRSNHTIPEDSLTAESLEGDKQFNLKSGYLIVPEDGRLLNQKLAGLRAKTVNATSPDAKSLVQEIIPLLQTAYVFKSAEPMDGFPAKSR